MFEPSLNSLNHVEAIKLSDEMMIGPPKLTRFERARIVGARALQVSLGAPMLVKLAMGVSDAIDIAISTDDGEENPSRRHVPGHPPNRPPRPTLERLINCCTARNGLGE